MQEVNYGVFDPISRLVINPYSDVVVRDIALVEYESVSKTHERLTKQVQKKGIHYFVNSLGDRKIDVFTKTTHVKTPGEYFDNYEEAYNHLKKN